MTGSVLYGDRPFTQPGRNPALRTLAWRVTAGHGGRGPCQAGRNLRDSLGL